MDFIGAYSQEHLAFLWDGFLVTLYVAFISIILSFFFGLIAGTLRYAKVPVLSQMDVATSAKPSDTFAVKTPLELPLGVKLLEEKDISTEDGKRIIMTYGGEKSFTLIQEKAQIAKASSSVTLNGEPVNLATPSAPCRMHHYHGHMTA